ncbi:E3 ubiquitin-protein ligase PPP1R11 [Drosophila sulfurigaster albostrigata]|uniref:E3 ubiquitin-protein ligase PPP1R11 n=1 Tax=Drosophila sulfurigaster albostrigata TaxID=89887 RepID=UPI002D219A3A|nr:E3 ubiquitin-protein ligase PPP1R11 [Drosophila sulfurigaster albostrigata]
MANQPTSMEPGSTITETIEESDGCQKCEASEGVPTLQLRLEPPRDDRRVVFHEGVLDNEHMNRKKSKCCCIYKKPLAFGESSSEEDDECEHCFGHPEKRQKNKKKLQSSVSRPSTEHFDEPSTSSEAQSQLGQNDIRETIDKVLPPGFKKSVEPLV